MTTTAPTILDLHAAHRVLSAWLPSSAWRAAGALLVVGQSRDEQGRDTWQWPRQADDDRGYGRRTLGTWAGGAAMETIRRGERLLEGLGLLVTTHRPYRTSVYRLVPARWVELARWAVHQPQRLAELVEQLDQVEARSTGRAVLDEMRRAVARSLSWALPSTSSSAPSRSTTPAAPAAVLPTSLPGSARPAWIDRWAARNVEDPAAAWAAVEPALRVLAPDVDPRTLGGLGAGVVRRWSERGCPKGLQLAQELGLLLQALRSHAPGLESLRARVGGRGGMEALVRAPSYDSALARAQAWRDAELASQPLPRGQAEPSLPAADDWWALALAEVGEVGSRSDSAWLAEVAQRAAVLQAEAEGRPPPD
ncbi:hypothetical protein L6R53_14035 [Myxococcota bacterium]|nr:hypothetical protein [Myxococcota bacterium]